MHVKFKSEAEWLTLRSMNVGGSEVASLFNVWRTPKGEVVRHLYEAVDEGDICLGSLSPYKSGYRLYMEKRGELMPEDLADQMRIQAGQYLEPAIAAWAARRWPSWVLRKSRVYHRHRAIGGWGASLDYWVQEERKPPVDIKNVDQYVFNREWTVDPETGEIVNFPLHIALQLQHQIGCTAAKHAWVLACVGGNELRRGRVDRHEPSQAKIAVAVQAFWAAIREGLPPLDADLASVAEVFAFGGGDKEAFADFTADADASRAARRLMRWTAHGKFVAQQVDLLKGRVALSIGEGYGANFAGVRAVWPQINRQAKEVSYTLEAKTYRGGLTLSVPKPPKEKAKP